MASTTLRLWRLLPNLDDFMRTHFFLVCIGELIRVILMPFCFVEWFFFSCFVTLRDHDHGYIDHTCKNETIHTNHSDDFGISMVVEAIRSRSGILRRWERITKKQRTHTHTHAAELATSETSLARTTHKSIRYTFFEHFNIKRYHCAFHLAVVGWP